MASKEFRFHYVKTPTGAISGQSVLTQTEDAINNLGDYMVEATGDATEALNKATEALNTANTAQQNSAEALSTANSALGKVNTLTTTVNSFDGRIKTAESNAANAVTTSTEAANNAAQAVTTANSANKTAQKAVTTANEATTTAQNASAAATQAVGTANAANATAADAKRIAQQAIAGTAANLLLTPQGAKAMIDNALSGLPDSAVPSGVMVPFAGKTVPDGWLLCNGASLAKASYPDLFAAIGYTWGGSGNTFYLPNYNGRHILGTTYANNVGSTVSDGLPNIIGEAALQADIGSTTGIVTGAFERGKQYPNNINGIRGYGSFALKINASSYNSTFGRNYSGVSVSAAYSLIIIKA